MANTVVSQTRTQVANSDGDIVYRILSVVTAKGDLPHASVFVYDINDELDPTADSFLRVASPYDLTNLNTDRATAVIEDATVYLSPHSVNDFVALETAEQAKQELLGRVNTLVKTWNTYWTSFYTPTAETITFPNADDSLVEELEGEYATAKAARIAAEEDLATKAEDLTDAEDALATAQTNTALFESFADSCTALQDSVTGSWVNLQTELTAYTGGTDTFFDNMRTAYFDVSATVWPDVVPDPADDWYDMYYYMETWLVNIQTPWGTSGVTKIPLVTSQLSDLCNAITGAYVTAVNTESAAVTAVGSATEAKEKATATLAAAQDAEDEALAAVIAVCPDFDPTSV